MAIHCPTCDTENPDGGAFCIECGAPLRHPAEGSTERLNEPAQGKLCAACGTTNPEHASFCVNCGRPLAARDLPPRPAVATAVPPTITAPPMPAPIVPAGFPPVSTRPNQAMMGGITGGVFLIGLAVLFVTGWFWPGILILVGITAALGSASAGQPAGGLVALCWMVGLAVLFATGWFWPGILVLIGLTAILGSVLGAAKRRG